MINLYAVAEILEEHDYQKVSSFCDEILRVWDDIPINCKKIICTEIVDRFRKYINRDYFSELTVEVYLEGNVIYPEYEESNITETKNKFECWEKILDKFKEPLLAKPESETWEEYIGKLSEEEQANFFLFIYKSEFPVNDISPEFVMSVFEKFNSNMQNHIGRNSIINWGGI